MFSSSWKDRRAARVRGDREARPERERVTASLGVLALGAALCAGCVTAEPRQELPFASAAPFASEGTAELAERWWTAFGDRALDAHMERVLRGNYSLEVAWERVREARAFARRAGASFGPRLDAVASGELLDGSDSTRSSNVGLGLEASYEVDLWGRIRSIVDAEELRAAATGADYRAVAVALSADLAFTWYELAAAREQRALIDSQIATNADVLGVLEARFGIGRSDSADVLRQRQLVEASREQRIVVDARIRVLEHRLAILEGRPPQERENVLVASLPELPELPASGVPSELVERRPDVRAAYLRLEAADRDVAAAVRATYPRLDLSAGIATSARNPSGLFDDWIASVAAQIVAPLVDLGERRAEVERRVAVRRGLLASYGEAVLVAFGEVEDALVEERLQVRRIASLDQQLTLAEGTYAQLRSQYLNGAAEYIDVLIALRELQELRRDLVTARFDRVVLRITLHRALAGGFETPRETRADENTHGSRDDDERANGAEREGNGRE